MAAPETVSPIIDPSQRDILVAAAGGSLLSLLFMGQEVTWKVAVTAVVSGLFVAFYGVELAATAFHLSPGYYGAMGAGCGFASMTALGGFLKMLRAWRDDPSGFVQSWLPWLRKGGGQ